MKDNNTNPTNTNETHTSEQRFERVWCNHSLTENAETISEMVTDLLDAALALRDLEVNGVELDLDCPVDEGHVVLVTTDPEVAEIYDFEPVEVEYGDVWNDCLARRADQDAPTETHTYEMTWRNKWLTAEAKTMQDMIDTFQAVADHFREMQSKGVELDFSNNGNDYARLLTNDPAVAEKFGFEPEDEENCDCAEEGSNHD